MQSNDTPDPLRPTPSSEPTPSDSTEGISSSPLPTAATRLVSPQEPPDKRWVYILLVVLTVLLIGLTIWRVIQLHYQKQAAASKPATVATPATTVNPGSGSDNQSLSNDLTTVGNGLNTENQAQSAANSAIDDQQQEVNVPTN